MEKGLTNHKGLNKTTRSADNNIRRLRSQTLKLKAFCANVSMYSYVNCDCSKPYGSKPKDVWLWVLCGRRRFCI